MSDILFRYLLFARKREKSWLRRLFLAEENLLSSGVEQLTESAAARVEVTSQHERKSFDNITVPVSRHRRVTFYAVAVPERPTPGHPEERTQRFPLKPSLRIQTCSTCRGQGEVRCPKCRGRRTNRCWACGGSGRVRQGKRRRRCGFCGGDGRQTCATCLGSGDVTCGVCEGERQVATWVEEVYRWLLERRVHDEVPPQDPKRVLRAFRTWRRIEPDLVQNLSIAVAIEHLGYQTTEALGIVQRAEERRQALETEARNSQDRYLFHLDTLHLSPVAFTVLRWRTQASIYWLVGRGERAVEVPPRGSADRTKLLGWLGFGSGATLTWDTVVEQYALELPQLVEGLLGPLEASPTATVGGAISGWVLGLLGFRPMTQRPRPVLTVAVLPAEGRATPWLTCLAYLGCYTQRLKVLDRNYDVRLQRLLGDLGPDRLSRSLTLELNDGRHVRLVETPTFVSFSEQQLRLMADAVDGVLVLETAEAREPDGLAELLATAEPPTSRVLATIDRSADTPLGLPGTSVPVEAIRRAFVHDLSSSIDWSALFDQFWQPLHALLESPGTKKSV